MSKLHQLQHRLHLWTGRPKQIRCVRDPENPKAMIIVHGLLCETCDYINPSTMRWDDCRVSKSWIKRKDLYDPFIGGYTFGN